MLYLQAIINGIGIGSAYAMIGLALTVVYRTTRVVDFAVGAGVVAIAMLGSTIATGDPPDLVFAVVLLILGAAFGVAYYMLVARWISTQNHLTGVMATLAAAYTIQAVVFFFYKSDVRTIPQIYPTWRFGIAEATVSPDVIALTLGMLCAYGVSTALLSGTQFGRAVRAVSDDPGAASLLGINGRRVAMYAYALLGLLVGFAALLLTPGRPVDSASGFNLLVGSVIAITIGGTERLEGAIVGGWLVGIVQSVTITRFDALRQEISLTLILLCVLLWRPQGILLGLKGRDVR